MVADDSITDPIAAFIRAACAPFDAHASGTLDEAESIRAQHPDVTRHDIYAAAVYGDPESARALVQNVLHAATDGGGPYGWDPLTYLCFSRYLRLDRSRSRAFVETARTLLDAGASANTGWYETGDHDGWPVFESAIYGAAGVAQHAEVTRVLLDYGANPNDQETPYHVPETNDNTVLTILLESGRLNPVSLSWLLLRKADWHDRAGLQLLLDHDADPNLMTRFGHNALHHSIRRDNELDTIKLLLDHGADPSLPNARDRRSAVAMAARRGRGDVLRLLGGRGVTIHLQGIDRLVAACAVDDRQTIRQLIAGGPQIREQLVEEGGRLLGEFAGVGNTPGIRNLLDCGVSPSALYEEGDPYFGVAKNSMALHVAAWRASHGVVKELIARGAPVDALDGNGRSALALAIKACVDSYWTDVRSPDSVRALLDAGASRAGVRWPSGYDDVDALLRQDPA